MTPKPTPPLVTVVREDDFTHVPTQTLCPKCGRPTANLVGVHGRVFSRSGLVDCQFQPIEEES